MKRLARPGEIADAVIFFASDRAAFITVQVISVSGGLMMYGREAAPGCDTPETNSRKSGGKT